MRDALSTLIVESAKKDPSIIVLSADHGYSLFDALRKERPKQFINCGIIEQAMVGIASGLARQGFKPIVYGLASFVPMRCLEQIKLDVCYSNLPITFIGDGAGLVYAHLGASHHCAEDIAVLRPLPNITIYSPAGEDDLITTWVTKKPLSYIRIGKSDRPNVKESHWLTGSDTCIVAHGSMAAPAIQIAKKKRVDFIKAVQIHPFPEHVLALISKYRKVIVMEEHSIYGGLYSTLCEYINHKYVLPICLERKMADKCGDYQYALSEHGMDDKSLIKRVGKLL